MVVATNRLARAPRWRDALLLFVLCLLAASLFCSGSQTEAAPASGVRALVLGIAQDGGVPHIGCRQDLCVKARKDPRLRQRVASLGLVDDEADKRFLIDATPDLPSQIESLLGTRPWKTPPVDGILLTHAHVGHYTGLMYLGREALGASGIPVYATPRMSSYLRDNGPWSQLVKLGNIELKTIEPGQEIALTQKLRVTAVTVPHRDELSDTVGFRVRGADRVLLYVPDVDKWERASRPLIDELSGVDIALLDGTFYDGAELPGRNMAEVPHPLVSETVALLPLDRLKARVLFTHLNPTNKLLWDKDAQDRLRAQTFAVARDGEEIHI
jgi:pyrroloquinoline quinone biosynthesis protein B